MSDHTQLFEAPDLGGGLLAAEGSVTHLQISCLIVCLCIFITGSSTSDHTQLFEAPDIGGGLLAAES